jgi:RNA-directed DNA polymerase
LRNFIFKKKNPSLGFRTIHKAECDELENCLKILNAALSEIYKPIDCVHGFVNKKNIKTNATVHLAKKSILNLDIKDFFETIKQYQVIEALIKLGVDAEVAESISNITCVNGYLVQGYSTSPVLANIVVLEMDLKILESIDKEINYTRYADDLYFSTDTAVLNIEMITEVINSFGFKLNDRKTKIMQRGQKQYVTGLSVFDKNSPRIARQVKRNLRLEIYYITKFGYEEHIIRKLRIKRHLLGELETKILILNEIDKTRRRIFGWLHFINSIEPNYSLKSIDYLKKNHLKLNIDKLTNY